MAKYDWKQLEKEYILSDYRSVSAFLKDKGINATSGSTKKAVVGWKEKKAQKEHLKSTKVIEKAIEKESEREAEEIVNVKDVANALLQKIVQSYAELDKHIVTNKKKTKKVKYDYKCNKPAEEIIEENEEKQSFMSIIDRKGLKDLTSALKDLNDILQPKQEDEDDDNSFIEALNEKTEAIWNEEE